MRCEIFPHDDCNRNRIMNKRDKVETPTLISGDTLVSCSKGILYNHIMASYILRILSFNSSSSHSSQNSSPPSPTGSYWSKRRRRSSGLEEQYEPQRISGSWVDGQKLVELLNYKFGRHYKLQVCIASSCFPSACLSLTRPLSETQQRPLTPSLNVAEVKRVHVVCRRTFN